MTLRERKRIRARMDGAPDVRERTARSALPLVDGDVERLDATLAQDRNLFAKTLSSWTGCSEASQRPFVVRDQRRDSLTYGVTAAGCALAEAGLGALIAPILGLPFCSGIVGALMLMLLVHGAVVFLFRDAERPKQSLKEVKVWLGVPGAVTLLISLLSLMPVLRSSGAWALMFLPVSNIGLWLATLGFIFMGAALFTASYFLNWSWSSTKHYEKIERELIETRAVRDELKRALPGGNGAAERDGLMAAMPRPAVPMTSLISMLFVVGMLASSCTPAQGAGRETNSAIEPASRTTGQTAPSTTSWIIEGDFDTTGSCDERALRDTAHRFRLALPTLVRFVNAKKLRVVHLNEDSWAAPEVMSVELPQLLLPNVQTQAAPGELGHLRHIREELERKAALERAQQHEEAERAYEERLTGALANVKEAQLIPARLRPAACSDIRGALYRLAYAKESVLAILTTDGAETCSKRMEPVLEPQQNVIVVILVVPGKESPVEIGWEQFDATKKRLAAMAPWADVVPFFVDLPTVVADALLRKHRASALPTATGSGR
jgi:hypothetical protein